MICHLYKALAYNPILKGEGEEGWTAVTGGDGSPVAHGAVALVAEGDHREAVRLGTRQAGEGAAVEGRGAGGGVVVGIGHRGDVAEGAGGGVPGRLHRIGRAVHHAAQAGGGAGHWRGGGGGDVIILKVLTPSTLCPGSSQIYLLKSFLLLLLLL